LPRTNLPEVTRTLAAVRTGHHGARDRRRLTNRGLVDSIEFALVPPVAE
jgi:hypothetical protein